MPNYLSIAQSYGQGQFDRQNRELGATRNALARTQLQETNRLAGRQRELESREDKAYTDAQRMENTQWLASASEQALKMGESAIPSLIQEGKARGVIDPNFNGTIGPNELQIMAQGARSAMGGMAGNKDIANTDLTSDYRNYLAFSKLPPEEQQKWLLARRNQQIVETAGGTSVLGPQGPQIIAGTEAADMRERAADDAAAVATASTAAKSQEEMLAQQINDGYAGADQLPVINRGIELLDQGIKTGGYNAFALWANNRLGLTGADEGELSANLGKAVLSQLRSTFGAQFTEREGDRLQEIEAGFGKSAEVNLRLLRQARQISERAARRGIVAARRAGREEDAGLIEQAMQMTLDYEEEAQTTGPVQITTDQEYDALPSGTQYMDPDGNLRTKR